MKVHTKTYRSFGIQWTSKRNAQLGTWVATAVGVATTAYGAYSSSKTNKENKNAASQAKGDEEKRRARATAELNKAYTAFNALREERPGVTFDQWKNEYVKAISDPVLRDNFRKVKEEDFVAATDFASRASAGNVENFLSARDIVSQGAAPELTRTLNQIATSGTSEEATKRAMELRAGYIPSGTVQYDAQGRLVEGQRADKQVFTTAYEADIANRDRQFRMSRDLLNDYSTVADRQTERAKEFLQFASMEPVAQGLATKSLTTAIGFQQQDEQNQFDLIRMYAGAAAGVQPTQPTYRSTGPSDALMAEGISTAIKGVASYYGNRSTTPTYNGPSTYYTANGTEVRRALPA